LECPSRKSVSSLPPSYGNTDNLEDKTVQLDYLIPLPMISNDPFQSFLESLGFFEYFKIYI
jgi:hypothetical protein